MTSIEVPRGEWPAFLNAFAASHRDWLVNVQVAEHAAGDAGSQQMPLRTIGLEENHTGQATVTVKTQAPDGPSAFYTLNDANCVRVMKREDGVDEALYIGNEHGSQLLLHFVSKR